MTDHDPDRDEAALAAPAVENDALKDLDAALQVEPSRAFADGVRARVNRSRANATRVWWGLAAAASVGLVIVALWRPSHEGPGQVATASVQVPAPAPEAAPAIAKPAPEPAIGGRVFRPGKTSVVRVAANTTSEPRLEVITNQGAILRELWAPYEKQSMVEAVVDGPAPKVDTTLKPLMVDPIVVPPIVLTEIGKPAGSGGATPVIRRIEATRETR